MVKRKGGEWKCLRVNKILQHFSDELELKTVEKNTKPDVYSDSEYELVVEILIDKEWNGNKQLIFSNIN